MESVVVLCNHLQQMMVDQFGAKPTLVTLNKAIAAYQTEREARVKHIMDYSSLIKNIQAWRTPSYKFIANWVLPLQPDRAVADQLGEIINDAPKLNFVHVADFASGRLPWNDEIHKPEKQKKQKRLSGGSSSGRLARLLRMMSAAVGFLCDSTCSAPWDCVKIILEDRSERIHFRNQRVFC